MDPGAGVDGDIFEKLQISPQAVGHNAKIIDYIRNYGCILGGSATGILGLTGLQVSIMIFGGNF